MVRGSFWEGLSGGTGGQETARRLKHYGEGQTQQAGYKLDQRRDFPACQGVGLRCRDTWIRESFLELEDTRMVNLGPTAGWPQG